MDAKNLAPMVGDTLVKVAVPQEAVGLNVASNIRRAKAKEKVTSLVRRREHDLRSTWTPMDCARL